MKKQVTLLIGIILFVWINTGFSTQISTSFTVTLTITPTCNVTTTNLNFGSYDVFAATPTLATANITISCTGNTPYNVKLNKGTNGTSVTNRQMKTSSGATVNYAIYRDAARTLNWGESIGIDTIARTSTGGVPDLVIAYGSVPPGQNIIPGNYNDIINVTVDY